MSTVTIAAFDFDATLTRRDTVVPFLRRVAGTRRLFGGLAARPHQVLPALVRRDRNTLRAIATEVALTGVDRDRFDRHTAELAAEIVEGGLRDDTTARLAWHLEQGHRVLIVSASYTQYVRIVGEHLGVDDVLATQIGFDASGRSTGRLVGQNCRAEEKVLRLTEWLQVQQINRNSTTIWAYGDSNGDRAMLDFADHPVWVGEPLASVAATV